VPREYFNGHIFKKGTFITPLNQINQLQLANWSHDRMPEYLWLGLILDCFERTTGLEKCGKLLKKLQELSTMVNAPKISQILDLSQEKQEEFYRFIIQTVGVIPLQPLNLLLTTTDYPAFAAAFSQDKIKPDELLTRLVQGMKSCYGHQTETATDIRFLIIYFQLISGRLNVPEDICKKVIRYPYTPHSDEAMKELRPLVRSMEGFDLSGKNDSFINYFWEAISGMCECELTYFSFEEAQPDTTSFMNLAEKQLQFYVEVLSVARTTDNKMLVLLGIATYAFKRIKELVKHDLFHTISGRTIVRCIIECYIMMKYLCQEEDNKPSIWTDYQDYGLGQYKLILKRIDEDMADMSDSHLNVELMKLWVNQRIDEKFLNMDTNYFDKQGIREKSQAVSEKDLWSHYYDYDSAFEHGLWGAIRESSMLDCASVAHQYHFVPDIEDRIRLKSVWADCKMAMTKILDFLGEIYGYPEGFPIFGGAGNE